MIILLPSAHLAPQGPLIQLETCVQNSERSCDDVQEISGQQLSEQRYLQRLQEEEFGESKLSKVKKKKKFCEDCKRRDVKN